MPDKTTDTEKLIDQAFSKRLEIALHLVSLEALQRRIIALGAGKHSGALDGNVVTVIAAQEGKAGTVSYELPDDGESKARELAGDQFAALFDRVVAYVPIEGFALVVPKLIKAVKKAKALVALCQVHGKATSPKKSYLIWPKPKE